MRHLLVSDRLIKGSSASPLPEESSQLSMQPPRAGDAVVQSIKTKLKPIAPSHVHPQTQKSSFGENEENVQSHETGKKTIVVFAEGLPINRRLVS